VDLVEKTSRRIRKVLRIPSVASKMRVPLDDGAVERFMASELASELYVDEVLTGDGSLITIDSPVSVSGLDRTGQGLRPIAAILPSVARILHDV